MIKRILYYAIGWVLMLISLGSMMCCLASLVFVFDPFVSLFVFVVSYGLLAWGWPEPLPPRYTHK